MEFIENSFSLRLAAVVIHANFVKRAVKAAMQINPAIRALRLPPDKKILRDFLPAFITNPHANKQSMFSLVLVNRISCLKSKFIILIIFFEDDFILAPYDNPR
jgi:hypothetical protein